MYEKLIDKIVWWIPFKKIRDLTRYILNSILNMNNNINNINNNINTEIYNKISNINNNILNIIINNFTEIDDTYTINNKYDFIFSIGENCFTASLLSENNLRTQSSPFDWVTPINSTDANIIKNLDIIKNRFINFFKKEDFTFAFKDDHHNVYFNTNTCLYHPHDVDINTNFDTSYNENLKTYSKRIDKLIKKLESNKKILMVYIEFYRLENSFVNINTIIDYIIEIRKIYNNQNIYLLYVKHNYYINEKKIYFKNIDEKIDFYILDNSFDYKNHKENSNRSSEWCNNVEKTNKILSRYKLQIDDL